MSRGGIESYYIKEKELYLLLAGKGVERFYGIGSNPQKGGVFVTTVEEIHTLLSDLYKKGYIEWEDKMIVICNPISSCVDRLREASYCIIVDRKETQQPPSVCYFSREHVVLVEECLQQEEMLRMTELSFSEFLDFLWEYNCFPHEEIMGVQEGEVEKNTTGEYKEKVVFLLMKVTDGTQVEKLIVSEFGLQTSIIREKGLEKESFLYQRKKCEEIFREWRNR